jgi:predicted lipoprotein with Yx(FWY)xxD motif
VSKSRWLAAVGAVAVLTAGCQAAVSELHPGQEELTAATKGSLGQILIDDEGRTLYLFEKDDEPDESYCHGACESVWPPVTTSRMPEVGAPLDASKVTLLERENGLRQVVYAGHPLYYYQGDTSRADTNGQEKDQFGAEWYTLRPSGQKAEAEEGGESGESDES